MDFNQLFSPLSREFCLWFYYLSVIGFVFLVITLISAIIVGFTIGIAIYAGLIQIYLKEQFTPKIAIQLILCFVILSVQAFMK